MGLLVRDGTIVTVRDLRVADILCRDGRVVAVGRGLESAPDDQVIEAGGHFVFPGGVDPHVHMELPVAGTISSDDFETGSAAAVAGGTTTIIDFVHSGPGRSLQEALAERKELAAKSVIDYGLHVSLTADLLPAGSSTARLAEVDAAMTRCVQDEGILSFKVYMAYGIRLGSDELRHVAAAAAQLGAVLMVHAEEGEEIERRRQALVDAGKMTVRAHALSRPPETEARAVERVIAVARETGAPVYLVHLSCRESVALVEQARREGLSIDAETGPQYLLLDESVYERPFVEAAAGVMAPPLRPASHREALWTAVSRGAIQTVGSDHCPFDLCQKSAGRDDFRLIPGGAAGVEHRLALLYTYGVRAGRIDLHRFVDLTATRPARIFGLYPRKGTIAVGSDADLVIWDHPAAARLSATTHHHRCDLSVFDGWIVRGLPRVVVAGGRVVFRDGALKVARGAGRYLPRLRAGREAV